MPSKSKIKGSGFERDVAKYLTEKYGETFTRVPNSGAFIGGKNSHRKEFLHEGQIRASKGDLIPGQSFPRLNVECKNYGEFGFHLLFTESSQMERWLEQLMDVADTGDLNVLFFKANRVGKYIAVEAALPWYRDTNHLVYSSDKHGEWLVYEFENFFSHNEVKFKSFSSSHYGTQQTPSLSITDTKSNSNLINT
jgi:hypothetical protein